MPGRKRELCSELREKIDTLEGLDLAERACVPALMALAKAYNVKKFRVKNAFRVRRDARNGPFHGAQTAQSRADV